MIPPAFNELKMNLCVMLTTCLLVKGVKYFQRDNYLIVQPKNNNMLQFKEKSSSGRDGFRSFKQSILTVGT